MPQFSGDPDSFAFDDEVPMIELEQDEIILHDSNGKPTLVVDKNRYYATTNSKGKQTKTRARRKQHQRHSKNSSKSSEDSGTSTLLQPPALDHSKSATPSDSGTPLQPSTPKTIPPFFQFMGAVASRAKDFFNGPAIAIQPPGGLPNASSDFPAAINAYGATMDNKEYLKHQQQNSFGQFPFPPQYQTTTSSIPGGHVGGYSNHSVGYMQQPENPIMPPQGFMDTPSYGLPPMPAMLSAEEPKKSKKHRKHKKSKKDSLEQSLLQSRLFPVLILLAGALLSVMISTYRPVVEGPISGVVDKMLTNLQMLASLSMTAGGAMLAYKYLGNSAVVEKSDGAGLGAPLSAAISSIPIAGTSLGDTPAMSHDFPGYTMMAQQQPWMQNQQPMYQGPSVYENSFGNMYEKKEMLDQKQYFVPAGTFETKKHGRNTSVFDINSLSQKLNALTPGGVQDPLGLYTDDDDEYVDVDEEEEEYSNYYKAMPDIPGPYPAPRTTATALNMMRPEIIELLRRSENEAKIQNSTSSPAPRTASTGVPTTSPAPAPKHKKKASTDSKASAAKTKSSKLERIKGVGKKSKDFYVDDYACKPYGPPPKRYRGVNI